MKKYSRILIILLAVITGMTSLSAQTEDSLVVELLYKANSPQMDDIVHIDRATIFKYGEVELPSVPLERFNSLEYSIDDTFGTLKSRGRFRFDREKLKEMNGTIPVNVMLNGVKTKGFIKIPYNNNFRFNFYTDKIKPVLNFWINVERIYEDGKILPMSSDEVLLSTSYGEIRGLELILPEKSTVKFVTITACLASDHEICIQETLPIMKQDDRGYWEDEDEYQENMESEEEGKVSPQGSSNIPGYVRKSYYDPEVDDEDEEEILDLEDEYEEEEDRKDTGSDDVEYDSKWDYLLKKIKKKS